VLVVCTGSQGEPLAALNRYAAGTHPHLRPDSLDTVIFSSRTIPGNDVRVHSMQNKLARVGVHLVSADNAHVHVSGHGSSAELLMLLQLIRPTTFAPVHGEWRHMRAHAALAHSVGINEDHVLLLENGVVVELVDGVARISGDTVHVGEQLVDRTSNDEILEDVLEERQQAGEEGVLVVVAHRGSGTLELISRGFVEDTDDSVLEDARAAAQDDLLDHKHAGLDDLALTLQLQTSVERLVQRRTRRSPLVVPVVLTD
jgi:ribonuclease J